MKMFDVLLITYTKFELSGSLRKLNRCLNWKVEMPIHHVWFTKVYVLAKNHKLVIALNPSRSNTGRTEKN